MLSAYGIYANPVIWKRDEKEKEKKKQRKLSFCLHNDFLNWVLFQAVSSPEI